VATISGIPTVAGLFSYTVTLTGGCGSVYASGTVVINTTTWTGSWSNGAPTASVGAVISANYAENVDLTACILMKRKNHSFIEKLIRKIFLENMLIKISWTTFLKNIWNSQIKMKLSQT
jgi:hypothetical protein